MAGSFTYVIRPPASKKEWDVVRNMLQSYQDEFEDQTCFTSFEEELRNIERFYADPRKYKLIAVEYPGNTIVGCVGLRALSAEVAEMKRLYVIPSHRGLHIGKMLAEEIISVAQKMKFHKIVLDTMHEMHSAQKLYKGLGFVTTPPHDATDTRNVVYFEKVL